MKNKKKISKIVAGSILSASLTATSAYASSISSNDKGNIENLATEEINQIDSELIKQFINVRKSKLGRFDPREFGNFNDHY